MPAALEIRGSAVRDFQMLERNLLTHVRLAVLLSVLSSSLLLDVGLSESSSSGGGPTMRLGVAALQIVAATVVIAAGVWEYGRSWKDLRDMRGFLAASSVHFLAMLSVALMVLATCIAYLVQSLSAPTAVH